MEVADKADLADIVDLEAPVKSKIRNNWTTQEIEDLYNLPFAD